MTTSNDGGVDRPEDRGSRAFDGDLSTAWRVGGADPLHSWIEVRPDRPIRTDHVDLVQPLGLPRDRWITNVTVERERRDRRAPSRSATRRSPPAGQTVRFPATDVRSLRDRDHRAARPAVRPRASPTRSASPRSASATRRRCGVREMVRLPVDVARRIGSRAAGHSLAVVLSRLRQETGADGRQDEEPTLDRRFVLPDARSFTLSGTARVDPNAPDAAIDRLLGTATPDQRYEASSHLARRPRRARVACVHRRPGATRGPAPTDRRTSSGSRWRAPSRSPPTTSTLHRARRQPPLRPDRRSPSSPTTARSPRCRSPCRPRSPTGATTTAVPFTISVPDDDRPHLPALGRRRARTGARCRRPVAVFPPVSIGQRARSRASRPRPTPRTLPTDCTQHAPDRRPGRALPPHRRSRRRPARARHRARATGPVALARGSHRVLEPGPAPSPDSTSTGSLLTSGASGAASRARAPRAHRRARPAVHVDTSSPTEMTVRTTQRRHAVLARPRPEPQRRLAGDRRRPRPRDARRLVDGYANAWLVHPDRAGPVTVHLSWTPQRTIWIALAISAVDRRSSASCCSSSARRAGDGAARTSVAATRRRTAPPTAWSWRRPGVALRPRHRRRRLVAVAFAGTAFVSRLVDRRRGRGRRRDRRARPARPPLARARRRRAPRGGPHRSPSRAGLVRTRAVRGRRSPSSALGRGEDAGFEAGESAEAEVPAPRT